MPPQARKSVTKIDATRTFYSGVPVDVQKKRNAAGYARVSTDHDEQFTSYTAQVDYYTKYIRQNPDWNFVAVYTDEGISGTSRKKRDGFNRMIKDALDGKIDVIITKSISRFARNTVDTLTTVRELKDHGVEVIFEKENIRTFDSNGEMLITIMSSIAQEESRSISANITWGHRKRFADGKLLMAFSSFLGYDRGPTGEPVINEEQAEVVRRIYFDFIHGMTPSAIAKQLTKEQVPTPAGCTIWKTTTVEHILKNEKYKGCALLQKSFTVDFLTKKTKVNEGEVPQYYVENSHPAIIDPAEWELAQIEFERRARLGRKYVGGHIFSCKIICADCGGYFGAKVWNSTSRYRRRIWQCNDKYTGEKVCSTPHVCEDILKEKFVQAANILLSRVESVLADCDVILSTLGDFHGLDNEIERLDQEMETLSEVNKAFLEQNASTEQDQDVFLEKYSRLTAEFDSLTAQRELLQSSKQRRIAQAEEISLLKAELLRQHGPLTEFDEMLWITCLEQVTVLPDGALSFKFKIGVEITV